MGEVIRVGHPPVEVEVRRRRNARRLTLRVSHAADNVYLTAPVAADAGTLRGLVEEKEGWLRDKLLARPAPVTPQAGQVLPLRGVPHLLAVGSGRTVVESAGCLYVPGDGLRFVNRLKAYLKEVARIELTRAADFYADRLGRSYGEIRLRDTRSRWGSCSSDGRLMFSWRLVMAPPAVMGYVAAHEVAHLAEMNHSSRFWDVLARIEPDYERSRAWLRGPDAAALHRYQF